MLAQGCIRATYLVPPALPALNITIFTNLTEHLQPTGSRSTKKRGTRAARSRRYLTPPIAASPSAPDRRSSRSQSQAAGQELFLHREGQRCAPWKLIVALVAARMGRSVGGLLELFDGLLEVGFAEAPRWVASTRTTMGAMDSSNPRQKREGFSFWTGERVGWANLVRTHPFLKHAVTCGRNMCECSVSPQQALQKPLDTLLAERSAGATIHRRRPFLHFGRKHLRQAQRLLDGHPVDVDLCICPKRGANCMGSFGPSS